MKNKIAIIGIRGLPVIYSGFESFIEVLAPELVNKGFDMWVYNRSPYVKANKKKYHGVNLITLPTLQSKNFETIIHSFLSTLHACLLLKPKVIYYLGLGNSPLTIIPKIFKIKTVINVDGLDWRREKWGTLAKAYLRIAEYLATKIPDRIITDSKYMHQYYLDKYQKQTEYITYPFDIKLLRKYKGEKNLLAKYNLIKNKYFVWVGRLVPENKVEILLEAFKQIKTDYKCVIIGDDFYNSAYKNKIYELIDSDRRMVRTGFLPRNKYASLLKNAFCYVETKCSGGTHPSLIEAINMNLLILKITEKITKYNKKSVRTFNNCEIDKLIESLNYSSQNINIKLFNNYKKINLSKIINHYSLTLSEIIIS